MSDNHFGSSLIYRIRQQRSKRQSLRPDKPESLQNNQQMTFYLTYEEYDQSKTRRRSEIMHNYSQASKIYQKDKVLGLPRMPLQKEDGSDLRPAPKISVNFDLFNNKPKNRQHSLDNEYLQRYEETAILFKQKYLEKVEKRNRKKSQRCKILKSFGLHIRTAQRSAKAQNPERSPHKSKSAPRGIPTTHHLASRHHSSLNAQENTKSPQKLPLRQGTDRTKSFLVQTLYQSQKDKLRAKLQKMIISQNVVLMSFGCYLQQGAFREGKMKYFVGQGNNKNLIRYMLSKRWWWTQTNDPLNANLIWTQLKHKPTLQRLQLFDHTSMEMPSTELFGSKTKCTRSSKEEAYQLFFHKYYSPKYCLPIADERRRLALKPLRTPECVHNHFSSNSMLGNKNALFKNLSEYFSFKKLSLETIVPLTFLIQSWHSKDFEDFQKKAQLQKNSIWIVKPGQNSNRGNGIFVASSPAEIKERLSRKKSKHTYIVQKYITNLMLYQKRKFDIRTYMLMLSIRGVVKFFWYNEGYIRTSSSLFDLRDLSDFFIHLTNDAVQNKNDSYGKFQQGNKVSYHEFQLYLDNNFSQSNFSIKALHQQMKDIALHAVRATYHKIDPLRKIYGFQLFGLDFIVDSQFRPWLIEVNTNPCLQVSSPVLERIIPLLLQNIFRVAVDPVFQTTEEATKPKQSYLYDSCLQKNKFQLMFDSLFDRDLQWQQVSCAKLAAPAQDTSKTFENEGPQITDNI